MSQDTPAERAARALEDAGGPADPPPPAAGEESWRRERDENGHFRPGGPSRRRSGRRRAAPAEPAAPPPVEDQAQREREQRQREDEAARAMFDALVSSGGDEFATAAGELYGLPFSGFAAWSGCAALELDAATKKARGELMLKVARHYAPWLARHLPLILFASVAVSDASAAVITWKAWKARQAPPPAPERAPTLPAPIPAAPAPPPSPGERPQAAGPQGTTA